MDLSTDLKRCKNGSHCEHHHCYTPAPSPHGEYHPHPSDYYFSVMRCCHCGIIQTMGSPTTLSQSSIKDDVKSWEEIQKDG